MRSTKRILDPKSKLSTEIQGHVTHTPIEDHNIKTSGKDDHKTDEADIRTFLSNTDTYDVSGNEYDGDEQDYLK